MATTVLVEEMDLEAENEEHRKRQKCQFLVIFLFVLLVAGAIVGAGRGKTSNFGGNCEWGELIW